MFPAIRLLPKESMLLPAVQVRPLAVASKMSTLEIRMVAGTAENPAERLMLLPTIAVLSMLTSEVPACG